MAAKTSMQDKLIRSANKRVSKAIRALEAVGRLYKFEPTKEQQGRIVATIEQSVEAMKDQLASKKDKAPLFQLER